MSAEQGWEAVIVISSAVLKGLRVKALCLLSEATGVPSGLGQSCSELTHQFLL